MKIRILLIMAIVYIQPFLCFSQEDDTLVYKPDYFNVSYTYIFQDLNENSIIDYHEHTFRLEYARRISKRFIAGFDSRYIQTYNDNTENREEYWIYGGLLRFIIEPGLKKQFYIEGSFQRGNFCQCGESFSAPYKQKGVLYVGFGAGVNWKLYKNFHLQLAFMNYQTVKPFPDSYAYTQYIIGLGYNFDLIKTIKK